MSTTASVMDLFAEYAEGGGGAAPYHEPGEYTLEAVSYYIPDAGTSLALNCKVVEGPATGQALDLGFIINTKSPESFKRALLVSRLFGITDEFLMALSAKLQESGGLTGDTAAFLDGIGKALVGRVFKVAVAQDDYAAANRDEQRNTLAKRAKPSIISAPALPVIAGAAAAVPVAAVAAAPAPTPPEVAAPAVAPPAPVPAAAAVPPAVSDPVAEAEAALAAAQAAATAAQAAAAAPAPVPAAAPVAQPAGAAPIPVEDPGF